MQTVLIVIHLMIVLALVGVVLIQRSEGGGLGIGGGSGFMSARGTANALTRTTAILATLFFLTSLALGILARYESRPSDILNRIPQSQQGQGSGILDQLGPAPTQTPAPAENGVPSGSGAAAPAPAAPATGAAPATPAVPSAPAEPAAPAAPSGVPTGQ
ncbi:preprotein translocase subunit SecG [Neorhizobium sp. Rsf11]|uniref:Protein-export membrane protein SecG n=2 Tax=Neorhizobium TaxID=1525371 RepID=A0ABV0M1F3_9HYPH|nr:preprotein translocase subunit SecG [Neorhizobium petrolearium]MCC2610173.1 preprotein translocase subunit SecG [Neorhizobium petrolearium]WGI70339.1 preprotein translocase subunit SecG [Neorhizobium petrolearium]